MSVILRRSCGAVLAYSLTTYAALADVTAQDVWADWQSYMHSVGYVTTGDASISGAVTTISNVKMTSELPEEGGQIQVLMPEMTLTENTDGTVTIGVSESLPITISGAFDDQNFEAGVVYTNAGLDMVVSGSAEDMTYTYSADQLKLVLDSITVGDEALPPDLLTLALTLNSVEGVTRMLIGEQRDATQTFSAADLDYELTFSDPDTGDNGRVAGQLEQIALDAQSVIPIGVSIEDARAFYDAGFSGSGTLSYGKGSTSIAGTAEGEAFSVGSSSDGGTFGGSVNGQRLAYNLQQNSSKLAVTTSDLPFPIEIAMEQAGLDFEFPVQASDQVEPFALAVNLTNFTMSDVLWSLFDPAAALPRDPATIALDTSGTAKILVDFLDPVAVENVEAGAMPGELHSLKISELLISMVGAKLTGSGDFTFDNSNTEELGGIPSPTGEANLQLVGANGLLDKLIGMGFVSDNDALGARMMMGLMAVPGDGPDTLNSRIEFTEEGHILANGQRLK